MSTPVNRPWYQSGWVIVLGLVLCWPLGLLFALLRIKNDRSFHMLAARLLGLIGWSFLVVSLLAVAGMIAELPTTDDVSTEIGGLVVMLLFAVGSIVMIRKAKSLRAGVKVRRSLIDQVVNQQVTSIDEIAQRLKKKPGEIVADLYDMSEGGFLPGYQIDPQNRRVWRPAPAVAAAVAAGAGGGAPQLVQFVCTGCGARNQIHKTNGRVACEYCDAPAVA
jgi:hypothetical protein